MGYEVERFPYDGAIDADGHVIEPADLWETYLEEKYRDRAIRVRRDDEGYEYFEFAGEPSRILPHGYPGTMGAMGDPEGKVPRPDRPYMEHMPYGASDPRERLDLLDQENLERAILYPTIGILWEAHVADPELSLAYARAYNRWVADFCRDSGGRLIPAAHLSLLDPEGAAKELERAVADGCKGAFITPWAQNRKPPGHPDHDPIFAKAVELDVPLAIHPALEPPENKVKRHDDTSGAVYAHALAAQPTIQSFLTFFNYGVFDRFPDIRLGILESGAGWVGAVLDRLDAVHDGLGGSLWGKAPLKDLPSTYFKRQCFISCDPDETAAPLIMDHVGADRFMWATDYPHPDHPAGWAAGLKQLADRLSPETRVRVLGQNVKEIFRLG